MIIAFCIMVCSLCFDWIYEILGQFTSLPQQREEVKVRKLPHFPQFWRELTEERMLGSLRVRRHNIIKRWTVRDLFEHYAYGLGFLARFDIFDNFDIIRHMAKRSTRLSKVVEVSTCGDKFDKVACGDTIRRVGSRFDGWKGVGGLTVIFPQLPFLSFLIVFGEETEEACFQRFFRESWGKLGKSAGTEETSSVTSVSSVSSRWRELPHCKVKEIKPKLYNKDLSVFSNQKFFFIKRFPIPSDYWSKQKAEVSNQINTDTLRDR